MLNSNFMRKMWNCISCRILLFVLAFIILLIIFLNPILNGIIKPKIVDSINQENKLDISIDELHYSIFSNGLSAKNIIINFPDSIKNNKNEKINIPYAAIGGVSWLRYFLGNGLSFNNLEIRNFNGFIIRKDKNPKTDSSSNKGNLLIDFIKSIPEKLKPLEFHEIVLNNFSLTSFVNGKGEFTDSIKTFRLRFKGLYADSSVINDSLSLKFADEFDLFAIGVKYHFLNDYLLKIDTMHLSTKDSLFLIKDFKYEPYVSDNEFFSHREFSTDRYIIKSILVSVKGIEYKDFIWNGNVYLRNIFIETAYLNIASNISGRFDPSTFPEMPNEIFRSLKRKINIDKINISKSKIFVQSKYSYSKKYAQISFFDVNAAIKNISNIPSQQTLSNPCKINITALLENEGKLSVEMSLPLLSKDISFNYKGHLDSMSVLPINSQLEIADLTRLTSGKIKYVDFSVEVKDRLASIYVKPIYENLKIKKLGEDRSAGLLEEIISLFANTVVIRESNPDNSGEIKIGRTIYFRKQYDTFLDLVWISVKKGIGKVVGF